jgi:hypothetical protein
MSTMVPHQEVIKKIVKFIKDITNFSTQSLQTDMLMNVNDGFQNIRNACLNYLFSFSFF